MFLAWVFVLFCGRVSVLFSRGGLGLGSISVLVFVVRVVVGSVVCF